MGLLKLVRFLKPLTLKSKCFYLIVLSEVNALNVALKINMAITVKSVVPLIHQQSWLMPNLRFLAQHLLLKILNTISLICHSLKPSLKIGPMQGIYKLKSAISSPNGLNKVCNNGIFPVMRRILAFKFLV